MTTKDLQNRFSEGTTNTQTAAPQLFFLQAVLALATNGHSITTGNHRYNYNSEIITEAARLTNDAFKTLPSVR